MTRSTPSRLHPVILQEPTPGKAGAPTVASLGRRLVPVDARQGRRFAELIASVGILKDDCESLFQRIIDLLDDEYTSTHDGGPPSTRASSE